MLHATPATPLRNHRARRRARRLTTAAALLSLALLGGCATSYQPSGFTGGFDEVQLSENVWRVQFRGNGLTSSSRAEDLALLRCAELTLIQGYSHFAIVSGRHGTQTSAIPQTATSITTAVGGSLQTTTFGGGMALISRPSSRNTVMMFKGAPEDVQPVYDAQQLCRSLGAHYDVHCGA